MKRPVVGIIGSAYLVEDSYPVQFAGVSNLDAVAHVTGALPLIFPTSAGLVDIDALCDQFDGILLTGARANVHPSEYGHAETPAYGTFDRDRDRVALPLIRACVDRGIPILGICRGFQEVNVAFGGTLHPEIREIEGRMNHRMPPDGTQEEKFALRHDVTLTKGGKFAQIFGTDVITTNSLHGQGIEQAGDRVIVEGHATDGTPEAIHIQGAKNFAMAVQWHPEWRAGEDAVSKPLFKAFGAAMRGD